MSKDDTSVRERHMNTDSASLETQTTTVPQSSPSNNMAVNNGGSGFLGSLDPKWRNWWIRGIFAFIMIGFFMVFIYMGPLALNLLVFAVFTKCFQEIIKIGHSKYQEHNLPLFRVLNWFLYIVFSYFVIVYNAIQYYPEFFSEGIPDLIATYHKMICFVLYMGAFVLFVLTLQKDYYGVQFTMFGWTHITIFFLSGEMFLIAQNIYEGLFWFLLPVSIVICNDIMAYVFGFFFGRTKLINLSPKKTWEGFLGAFVSTIIFGFLFAYILARFDLACYATQTACENSPLFKIKDYTLPLGMHFQIYPVMIHAFPLAVFASLIAPFGGFFASGFKRAFKIKDFADTIPGHGGLVDRVDCQFVMLAFANVYYFTFCSAPNISRVLSLVSALTTEQQLQVLQKLQEKLNVPKT